MATWIMIMIIQVATYPVRRPREADCTLRTTPCSITELYKPCG